MLTAGISINKEPISSEIPIKFMWNTIDLIKFWDLKLDFSSKKYDLIFLIHVYLILLWVHIHDNISHNSSHLGFM